MDAFAEYFTAITDGKIVACEKMKQVSHRLLTEREKPGRFHFDASIGQRHIDFIERFCCVPVGAIGTPLKLELFQKASIMAAFGFVDDDGLRRFNEVLEIVGRKNGKTTKLSAVGNDLMLNDGEGAPFLYSVATKHDQAKILFNSAHIMVKQSPHLKRFIKKRAADLYCPLNEGIFKPLSSDTSTMDGLDIHGGFIDELGAIKDRDIYDLVKQGMAARRQPLLWIISTRGFIRDNIFDALYEYATAWLDGTLAEGNERFLPLIYELDDRDEWDDPAMWIKANPGLGTIKSEEFLAESVARAKDDPSFRPTVMVKDFNMVENVASSWLTFSEMETREPVPRSKTKTRPATFILDDMEFDYCIGGLDAADSLDLNAAVAICQRRGLDGEVDPRLYVESMFWLPESVLEEDARSGNRRERDSVPYQLWERRGLLRTVPGNKVDKNVICDWFIELRDEHDLYVYRIGYDPWHIEDALKKRFMAEFGRKSFVPIRQGVQTLSAPMKDLRADLRANLIVHNQNPILMWNLANTQAKSDVNGEIQPVKSADPSKRIDGTAALLDAYVVWRDCKEDYHGMI